MVDDGRCVVCRQWITDSGWAPFCCEVCFDSDDAQTRREIERWWEQLVPEEVEVTRRRGRSPAGADIGESSVTPAPPDR